MVKRRRESGDEARIENWANKAGKPDPEPTETPQTPVAPPAPALPAHRIRAKSGPKRDGVLFRMNDQQRKLLDAAVKYGDIKQQLLLEQLIWERLEEEYGHYVPPTE